MPVSFKEIAVGTEWSRKDLASLWGYQAYQALARGVVTPAKENKIILFVTEEKQASATNYKDVLQEDILKWEGPNDHFAEERMIAARDRNEEIHLFHRPRHHMNFEYRGQIRVMQVEQKQSAPSRFIFEILDSERDSWTRQQVLAAFYLYLQVKPSEMLSASPDITGLAASLKKPARNVAAKLRAFAQLDPVIAQAKSGASDNISALDVAVWNEFQNNWTDTATQAGEAFEEAVSNYDSAASMGFASASDAAYLFQAGETREAIVQVRKNQHIFRKAILNSYGGACCITGIRNERLLVASHIVPWAQDIQNRLNPVNGLCLSALHDRAYDQGLITVLPNYSIRVGPELQKEAGNSFLSDALLRYHGQSITLPGRFHPSPEFLTWHAKRFNYI
jgi:putative restriction endonuclease